MYKKHHYRNQHGMATMAITLILLFIGTLVALYTAKTSIKEQQISANQYRADQSLSTANAALDWGVAYYTEARGFACDERLVGVLSDYFLTCPPSETDVNYKAILCTIYADEDTKCKLTYTQTNPLEIGPDKTENALSIGASEMYYAYADTGPCDAADGTVDGYCEYIPVSGVIGETYIAGTKTRVYDAPITVFGIGHSDDLAAKRIVSVDADTFNIFGDPGLGGNSFPLISKATTGANASIKIINRFANRSIWSGDELIIGGSTNTYVLEPGLGWNCNDITRYDDCVSNLPQGPLNTIAASDGINTINADIIDADTSLANLGPDGYFENVFGNTKPDIKKIASDMGHLFTAIDKDTLTDKDGKIITWNDATSEDDLANKTPLVWIDATGIPLYDISGSLSQLGTKFDPMVLIIDGNLRIGGTGNTDIVLVGIMYVTGTWSASANLALQGMMIVETESDLDGAGTPTLIYDANLFSGKAAPPPGTVGATVPGTWKDWLLE